MRRVSPSGLLIIVCLWLGLGLSGAAAAASLDDYFGSYVGVAAERDAADRIVEERHMDVVITPFRRGGFQIRWINVTLVDGRRDLPGVERRVAEVAFEPQGRDGLFVEARVANPFVQREEMAPLAGDPVRWAKLDDDGLHVFSFVVLPNGRYELHTYTRRLRDDGVDLIFERVVDGDVLRRIEGRAVRAD
jgi:hypothetical protein